MSEAVSMIHSDQKYNGKVHNRKDELRSYRRMISKANVNLAKAAEQGDKESMEYWNDIINNTQARIAGIIDQEDGHTYKKPGVYGGYVDATTKGIGSVVDSGIKVIDAVPKSLVDAAVGAVGKTGEAADAVGKALDTVA